MHEFLSTFLKQLVLLVCTSALAEDHYLLCKALCPFPDVLGLFYSRFFCLFVFLQVFPILVLQDLVNSSMLRSYAVVQDVLLG